MYIFHAILHFKAHEFWIDILFYDFRTKSIEISWYCKFVMYMLVVANLFWILWDILFFWVKLVIPIVSNLSSSHPSLCLLMFEHVYIPKTFNKYSAWDVFDSKIINVIHKFFVVWTTSTMMWVLWLSNHHKIIGFMGSFQIHAKKIIS
jgi:hypothetical protein